MKQKIYYLLALTFLLLVGGGKNVVHAATTEIYSYTPSTSENTANTEYTATGGKAKLGAAKVDATGFKSDNGMNSTKYILVTLTGNTLQANDIITINARSGSNGGGIFIATVNNADGIENTNYVNAGSLSAKNTDENLTYTVKSTDILKGKAQFYLFRNGATSGTGVSTYIKKITVSRETATAPTFSTNLPATATVGTGSTKTFTVASGNATSYQWYKGSSSTANPASDTQLGTGASYTYTAPNAEGTEYIYCVATNENGSTTSNVCTVTVAEFQTVTFGLTRPLTPDPNDETKGTMGDNVWNTADDTFTLTEIMGEEVSIDGGNRSYVINNVTYTAAKSYKKGVNRSSFDEAQFAGYSFVIPDGKKLDITKVDARLSDASNCTWTWKIEVQDANKNPLWNTGDRTTTPNSTTTASISDNSLVTALAGLVSGTYYAKIYFYQGGSTKCNTIDLTFTGNLKDADATAPTVTIASEQTMVKDAANTITSVVQAYPEATAYQWYSCNDAQGTNPVAVEGQTTSTLTVTPSAEGTLYYYLAVTNSAGTTNSNVCTITVVAEAEFSNFEAILNNGTGSLITSDEITNESSVSFGISVDGDGNAVRVAADSPMAFATVSGTYHSEHGLTGFKAVVKVPGNVKIKLGTCAWGGNVTIKNASNETVATANTNNGTCYHGNTSANKVTVYYEGEATTLTIEGGNYVPFISIEAVGNLSKYNVTFKNGEETVDSRTVYNDGIEAQAIGAMPSAAVVQGKQFIGWYTKTDGTGEFATASTVPTSDITYYANYVNLDIENGYVVVDNSGTNRRNGENFLGALAYANANASQNNPVKIFLKNGTYDLGDDAETTQLTGSYVSIIGESLDGTVITNVPTQEGLGTATLLYNKGEYNYLQDLTLHNNYPYGNSTGRAASLKDEGNYTICNNVWLYSHQDTYYSHRNHSNFYFKGGKISGCVDYMCGQSRVYFDGVTLSNDNRGTTMTANSELYVFNNCTIENGGQTYNFGRAWSSTDGFGDPVCVFLNTTLKDDGSKLASSRWTAAGINADYAVAGEYGTMNASGTDITPASNNVTFTKKNTVLNTILTAEQAAQYTMEYTLGNWAATAASDVVQATVSNVKLNGSTLSWEGTSDAYLIEKNGEFVALTSETSYTVSGPGEYTVRAANARGGFGVAEEATGGKVTLTWNIAVGTSATDITSEQTSSTEIVSETSMSGIYASKSNSAGKDNLSVKLTSGTAETAAATVTFDVPVGYAFIPYTAKAKVQPVTNDAMVKLTLSDTNNTISNSAASFKQGSITTSTLTATETKYYTGTVTLGIYCYDNSDEGYRLGTPITVSGELVPVVKITPTGYATFSSAYPLDFTEEIEGLDAAYYASAVAKGSVTMTELKQTVPASTGLFLKGTPNATVYIPVAEDGTVINGTNYLKPNTTATDIPASVAGVTYHYVFAYNNVAPYNPGFFNLGSSVNLGACKAYVETTEDIRPAAQAKVSILFMDAEPTGINDVRVTTPEAQGETYNLGGQRVGDGYKGIVIVNGIKVLK